MANHKPIKKSVSFQQDVSKALAGDQPGTESKQSSKASGNVVPQLKSGLLAVPFHNILILLGMFYLGLTSDVEGVMLRGFLTNIPIQIIYNYIVYSNLTKKSKGVNVPLLIGSSIFVSIVLAVPLFVAIVLMGAPVYKYSLKTLYLSLHLSLLIFSPLIVLYNLDLNQFKKLFNEDSLYRTIFHHTILSLVLLTLGGCWLGVIPIPLDWDRPWQQWPITLLVGAYLGGIIGGLLSVFVNKL
ncbi:Glycosylphosphatidylinositol anchor biosynthesis protein 11 [Candida viswanathii]|uniref:Glycosylphosphatidylinositol anchor biosynthesis protein 11 n=1 Tax=Candida viswanathii TaxID=5486 RepID=A0A367XZG7_9ASCO|nr:Glycosylphosphatidylinositol anchor biosynthesis protein 11 [Candida viswanathii]